MATHLLRSRVDINTIRSWLGHVSLATTSIYAEANEVVLEESHKALQLGCKLAGPPSQSELAEGENGPNWDRRLQDFTNVGGLNGAADLGFPKVGKCRAERSNREALVERASRAKRYGGLEKTASVSGRYRFEQLHEQKAARVILT
jgi:hypothetical protein